MSIHPANLLADWHFGERARQAELARIYEMASQDVAWLLDHLGREPLPARRHLAGRIWARLQGVAAGLARAALRAPAVPLPDDQAQGINML
jgi:hypothetical protein